MTPTESKRHLSARFALNECKSLPEFAIYSRLDVLALLGDRFSRQTLSPVSVEKCCLADV